MDDDPFDGLRFLVVLVLRVVFLTPVGLGLLAFATAAALFTAGRQLGWVAVIGLALVVGADLIHRKPWPAEGGVGWEGAEEGMGYARQITIFGLGGLIVVGAVALGLSGWVVLLPVAVSLWLVWRIVRAIRALASLRPR